MTIDDWIIHIISILCHWDGQGDVVTYILDNINGIALIGLVPVAIFAIKKKLLTGILALFIRQTKNKILRHLNAKPGGFKVSELINDVFDGSEPSDLKQALEELEADGYIKDVPFSSQPPFYYIQKPKGYRDGCQKLKTRNKPVIVAVALIAAVLLAIWCSRYAIKSKDGRNSSTYETEESSEDDGTNDNEESSSATESEDDGTPETVEISSAPDSAYATVKIGDQTWMAKNLNYKTGNSWCYENEESYCDEYGRLYDRKTALKVCPAGWHLPTYQEWEDLVEYIGHSNGKKLRAATGWDKNDYHDGNGTDDYGFSALPGGNRSNLEGTIGYGLVISCGHWWTATAESEDYTTYILMCSRDGNVEEHHCSSDYGYSVRCLQD